MLMLTFPLIAYVMTCVMRYITLQLCFKSLLYGGGEKEPGVFNKYFWPKETESQTWNSRWLKLFLKCTLEKIWSNSVIFPGMKLRCREGGGTDIWWQDLTDLLLTCQGEWAMPIVCSHSTCHSLEVLANPTHSLEVKEQFCSFSF